MEFPHEPVMVEEVKDALITLPEGVYVDGTCGSGGHSSVIGQCLSGAGRLLSLDVDPQAVSQCRERLSFLGERARVFRASYSDLPEVLDRAGCGKVHGVLLDLGLSSFQLDNSGRGFSFNRDEPLDMRMSADLGDSAADLLNTISEDGLTGLLKEYGEERRARAVARAVVRARKKKPITSSLEFAGIVRSVVRPGRQGAKDPATRSFQALRIAVNRELENLGRFLNFIPDLLRQGGRLVIIAYHSLEDRMVKNAFREWEKACTCPPDLPVCGCGKTPLFRALRRGGLKPTQEEVARNPRARSAVLRAAERI